MISYEVSHISDLRSQAADSRLATGPKDLWLGATIISARGGPGFYDFQALIRGACQKLRPFTEIIRTDGYEMYVMAIGANFTDMRKKPSSYNSTAMFHKIGVSFDTIVEDTTHDGIVERTTGLYAVAWNEIDKVLIIQNKSPGVITIFSNQIQHLRTDFASVAKKISPISKDQIVNPPDWRILMANVARFGDIAVAIEGAFDDKYRDVILISDGQLMTSLIS